MLPILGGLLATLAKAGINLLGGAIESKGKEFIEDKLNIKIPDNPTPQDLYNLKQLELEHEETLLELSIEKQKIDLELTKTLGEIERNENDNVTDRWKSDMASDSWLSKNIRPLGLCFVLGCLLVLIVLSAFKITVDQGIVGLTSTLGSLIVGAYYGGRSLEKVMHIKGRDK